MVFLLAHVEVGSTWTRKETSESAFCMQSSYRLERKCNGGNPLKIYLHNCIINGLCEAKLDGQSRHQTEASKECYNSTVHVNTCFSRNCGTAIGQIVTKLRKIITS